MKSKNIKQTIQLFFVLLLLVAASANIFAQGEKPKVSQDEANAAKKIEAAKDFPAKMKAAGDFFKKYSKTSLRKNIVEYLAKETFASKDDNQSVTNSQAFFALITDQTEADIIVPALINSFIKLKRLDEAFSTAEKYLPRHPEEVTVRLQLAIEGSRKLQEGDDKFSAQTKTNASEAIKLIEENKKPETLKDEVWKEYQTIQLPQLYTSLGLVSYFSGNKADAQANFQKTISLNETNVSGWYMSGIILNEEYQDLANQYRESSGKAQAELLVKANEKLDKVIEIFARVVALTHGDELQKSLNTQTLQDLENYYKYRHKGSNAGLQELIDKYKSKKLTN